MAMAVKRGGRRGRRAMAEINVTPFVDVMLVLLIVFMVTAPLLTAGVPIELPESQGEPLAGQDEPLAVTVAADGQVYLQESAIALTDIPARVAAIRATNPNLRVFVRGDRAIDYGRVMGVIGALNAAGVTDVALVSDVSSGG